MIGKYELQNDQRFIVGVTSFEMLQGDCIEVTQVDPLSKEVLVDFGGNLIDWKHRRILEKLKKIN